MLGNKEGAVLRAVEKGATEAKVPWRIVYELNGKYVQVRALTYACVCIWVWVSLMYVCRFVRWLLDVVGAVERVQPEGS